MNAFESEVSKSCKLLDIYYQKMAVGQAGKVKLKPNPYDGFIVHQGKFIPLELKSQVLFGSFPFSNIRDHQIEGLQKMVDMGCRSFILINQRRVLRAGRQVTSNRAWAIDFRRWKELLGKVGDRKSIPAEMFNNGDLLIEIPRTHVNKELVWDLRILIDEKADDDTSSSPGSGL